MQKGVWDNARWTGEGWRTRRFDSGCFCSYRKNHTPRFGFHLCSLFSLVSRSTSRTKHGRWWEDGGRGTIRASGESSYRSYLSLSLSVCDSLSHFLKCPHRDTGLLGTPLRFLMRRLGENPHIRAMPWKIALCFLLFCLRRTKFVDFWKLNFESGWTSDQPHTHNRTQHDWEKPKQKTTRIHKHTKYGIHTHTHRDREADCSLAADQWWWWFFTRDLRFVDFKMLIFLDQLAEWPFGATRIQSRLESRVVNCVFRATLRVCFFRRRHSSLPCVAIQQLATSRVYVFLPDWTGDWL